ncbi:MAG: cupin domain-containing protein [Acidimicrobiia bacterium]
MTVVNGPDLLYEDRPARRIANPFAESGPGESSARQVILHPVDRRSPHLHPHSEEVVYVIEGSGRVWIDGESHPVRPGSWVRIPAGTPHATLAAEPMLLACFFPHHDLAQNIEELDVVIETDQEERS